MKEAPIDGKIGIRPGVNVLGVLRHLEYKAWYALAEFVDNSIQSFLTNKHKLPINSLLKVQIEIDPVSKSITIRDNAGGIGESDMARAFRAAEPPSDVEGLCEFGMGMKSAACWFSPDWVVTTKAIGETVERTVHFEIDKILRDKIEEIAVVTRPAELDRHYTTIQLDRVYQVPQKRTLGKIREHLRDIYRCFLRDGVLAIEVGGEPLAYEEPEFLSAPRFSSDNEPEGEAITWRKPIRFHLADGRAVEGFAGLLSRGDTKGGAGLSLFRRGRAIVGTGDEKYRPEQVFGGGNSYESQRVCGELHLDRFEVSHTKDGFKWGDVEDEFLQTLRESLDTEPLPLLRQARNYRSGRTANRRGRQVVQNAVANIARTLERHGAVDLEEATQPTVPEIGLPAALPTPAEPIVENRTFSIEASGFIWTVDLDASADLDAEDWLTIASDHSEALRTRKIALRVALGSPFMRRIVNLEQQESLEPVLRIAAAVGLAEVLARLAKERGPGALRRHINALLRSSLSHLEG